MVRYQPITGVSLCVVLWMGLAACSNETSFVPQKRVLTTTALVDAGLVAVGDRQTVSIQLRSEGGAPVTVSSIDLENEGEEEAFVLLPWSDEDGMLSLSSGSEEVPSTEIVQVSFRPDREGYFHALMTVQSNDTEVEDGLWKVALRGMAQFPCGTIAPVFLDFGAHVAGGYFAGEVDVHNCGKVILTVAGFEVNGSSSYAVYTPDPIYVIPGGSEKVEIGFIPSHNWSDSSDPQENAEITFITNDSDMDGLVEAIGNDCSDSTDASWDNDNDGWFFCGGDCDDEDPLISPSNPERENGYDDDCDGNIDEWSHPVSTDNDSDGYTEEEGDCWDEDSSIGPDAVEIIDQIDNDCDGIVDNNTEWYDDDADGFSEREGDCDDSDVLIYPGARESIDGLDNDCDGDVDEGGLDFDDDGDGFTDNAGDCDDGDPWTYPDAAEDCDNTDNDCDTEIDEGDACAYLVDRDTTEEDSDTSTSDSSSGGCSVGGRHAARFALLLSGLLLVVGRSRRRA